MRGQVKRRLGCLRLLVVGERADVHPGSGGCGLADEFGDARGVRDGPGGCGSVVLRVGHFVESGGLHVPPDGVGRSSELAGVLRRNGDAVLESLAEEAVEFAGVDALGVEVSGVLSNAELIPGGGDPLVQFRGERVHGGATICTSCRNLQFVIA